MSDSQQKTEGDPQQKTEGDPQQKTEGDPQETTVPAEKPSDSTTSLPMLECEKPTNLLVSAAISASATSLNSVASSKASVATNKSGIRPPSKIGLLHGARPKTLQPAIPAPTPASSVSPVAGRNHKGPYRVSLGNRH
ncbi:unnamed protein product [Ceutorhynchus assimilis]|uniref:Uncharacterized protein n=1 Tax=Ceutorhynchus assimilis TaxID=467358 RepID=A0A9N9MF58_9CUCU|nr:unnamed protein product [Ceutorhynchus assimilis]